MDNAISNILSNENESDQKYAIKISPARRNTEEDIDEVKIMRRLQAHENVVKYCDHWFTDVSPFLPPRSSQYRRSEYLLIQMEFCAGGSLQTAIDQRAFRRNYPLMRCVLNGTLKGLEHVHRHGIIHRDVKPVAFVVLSHLLGQHYAYAQWDTKNGGLW